MTLAEMFDFESREAASLKAMGFKRTVDGCDFSLAVLMDESSLRVEGGRCFVEVAERTPEGYWEPVHRVENLTHASVSTEMLERVFEEAIAYWREMRGEEEETSNWMTAEQGDHAMRIMERLSDRARKGLHNSLAQGAQITGSSDATHDRPFLVLSVPENANRGALTVHLFIDGYMEVMH